MCSGNLSNFLETLNEHFPNYSVIKPLNNWNFLKVGRFDFFFGSGQEKGAKEHGMKNFIH